MPGQHLDGPESSGKEEQEETLPGNMVSIATITIIITIIITITIIIHVTIQGRDMASQRLSSALSLVNLGGAGQGVRDSRWVWFATVCQCTNNGTLHCIDWNLS